MKKLTKLKISNIPVIDNLTYIELSQLIGGTYDGKYGPDDIINTNSFEGCNCTFSNKTRIIVNDNTVDRCKCTCEYIPY